jgi:DNA end-binding protein Ku
MPLQLRPASSLSEKVSFNQVNRKMGNRLKQQNVDAETGEVISRDDTVRGYEVAKGQYMIAQRLSYSSWRRHHVYGGVCG